MKPILTLQEYRLSYPTTASVPTITQQGLIGPLLERQHRRILQSLRRRAFLKFLLTTIAVRLRTAWAIVTDRPRTPIQFPQQEQASFRENQIPMTKVF